MPGAVSHVHRAILLGLQEDGEFFCSCFFPLLCAIVHSSSTSSETYVLELVLKFSAKLQHKETKSFACVQVFSVSIIELPLTRIRWDT